MGVAWELAGSWPSQITFPVSASKARSLSSIAAAMKARPPAVTIEPPRLGDPNSDDFGRKESFGITPSGASHRISPVFKSTAVSLPQGGTTQGTPLGDISGSRYIAYGVPVCRPNSPFIRLT